MKRDYYAYNSRGEKVRVCIPDKSDEMPLPEQRFMAEIIDEFKDHVMVAMAEGHHENFEDHFDFLMASLEVFIQSKG